MIPPTAEGIFNLFCSRARLHAVCTIPSACRRVTDLIIVPSCLGNVLLTLSGCMSCHGELATFRIYGGGSSSRVRWRERLGAVLTVQGEFGSVSTFALSSVANCRMLLPQEFLPNGVTPTFGSHFLWPLSQSQTFSDLSFCDKLHARLRTWKPVSPKLRYCISITYFASLNYNSEDRENDLRIIPTSNCFRSLHPPSKCPLALTTACLSVGHGALQYFEALCTSSLQIS